MMYGIALVDVHSLTTRYARSALPAAPVLDGGKRHRTTGGEARRRAVRSRYG
jgi:hypothetical protein